MLVLSRREDDKILFPALGITVEILRVAGGRVRVGIDAPPEVKVLRHELRERGHELKERATAQRIQATPPAAVTPRASAALRDAQVRKRLESAAEALCQLHQRCDGALESESEQQIFEVFSCLKAIDQQLAEAANRAPVLKSSTMRSALLVEDNDNERKLLASYLRLRQIHVEVARDGEEALDYLAGHDDPDVVLIDMQMPGMDGASAVHRMRDQTRYRDLKVYAVSGGDPADYGLEISERGVNGWFPKPLDPEAVLFRLAFDQNAPTGERPEVAIA